MVTGDVDAQPEQEQGDEGQPVSQGGEQVEAALGSGDVPDWKSTKEALTCGIRSARVNPAATSCCLTVWMNAARLMLTVSPSTVTAPPPSPVKALTSSSWASRLACNHASANAGLWTILPTWVRVKLCTPLAIGVESARSWTASCGGRPRSARASTAWEVRPWT